MFYVLMLYLYGMETLTKDNQFFIWEEKDLIEPKKNFESKETSVPNVGINEIKLSSVKNECGDIGKKYDRIIYKTTNLINGKIYIGKDKFNNLEYFGSGKLIRYAIKKYGQKSFVKEILEYCENDIITNEKERYWIKKLNTRDKSIGYNISEGGDWGDTLSNHPNKKEILKKMSDASKKIWSNPIFKQKMCDVRKGKVSPHKGKKRLELIGKNIRIIDDEIKNKIIEMYKIMGVCKITKILKNNDFLYGKCAIINLLKRNNLYNREGKRGPFGENILKKGKNGQFISNK